MGRVKKRKHTYVYVVVDTNNIKEGQIDANVDLSDNWGGCYGHPGHCKSFISNIGMGKNITWCAIVKDAEKNHEHTVVIKEISRKKGQVRGARILKKDAYYEHEDSGVVIGKAKVSKITGEELYNIIIEVNGKDEYTIDPKMKMI